MLPEFVITDSCSPSVLGRDILKNMCLNWEKNCLVYIFVKQAIVS